MLKREIKLTQDGSPTIYLPEWEESYHSKHGALQEAEHVFIKNGLEHFKDQDEIVILEYGFGTGLNALLTLLVSEKQGNVIEYHSLEKFPITDHEVQQLPLAKQMAAHFNLDLAKVSSYYEKLHNAPWNEKIKITEQFYLKKIQADFRYPTIEPNFYNLIYFDAFGKRVQPNLWTEEVFDIAFKALKDNSLFTTYACNGTTKRALAQVGFTVEKISGPPGKREMINAWKNQLNHS
ncbi:MAG: tRNA (5-methylaminomethyl-2-thiouridine)(34)-methyltransferase MnmD [Weeksellaceae bacterium]